MAKQRHYHAHETTRQQALEGLPLAMFWQRAAGIAIDFFLVVILWGPIVIGWKYLVTHEWNGHTDLHLSFDPREPQGFIFVFVYFAIACFLGKGRTPGKWIARTRIVSVTHGHIGLWQSIERALGYGASIAEAGFGFFQYFIHKNRQCVHDRIAETVVVDTRKSSRRLEQATQE